MCVLTEYVQVQVQLSLVGELVSLNLDKIFLPLLKILPSYEAFLVT